jgi:hypothetical protein
MTPSLIVIVIVDLDAPLFGGEKKRDENPNLTAEALLLPP